MNKKILKPKEAVFLCFFILVFLTISVFSLQYGDYIRSLIISRNSLSVVIYVLFLIISEVVAPVSSLPILPLAVSAWGSLFTALISLLGWFAGAIISFWLARRFGRPLVGKIISLEKLERLSRFLPKKNLFWAVVFLRVIFPVDIFSYALGLLTEVSFRQYFWGTLIGIAPFGFLFSYGVRLPIQYQLIIGVLLLLITVLYYDRSRRKALEILKSET